MVEIVEKYSSDKGISVKDALQVFCQIIALKNIRIDNVCLIGGTALTLGHGNPRFSEDIDLTGVKNPASLAGSLANASKELSKWLPGKIRITAPKNGKTTWRIRYAPEKGAASVLHVDSQPYPAHTRTPIVITYPGITPFVFNTPTLNEIMADKMLALVGRNYVGGRDIFDLWYHWLRKDNRDEMVGEIESFFQKKLHERKMGEVDVYGAARKRLSNGIGERMKDEWERYLPHDLKKQPLYDEIFSCVFDFLSKVKT